MRPCAAFRAWRPLRRGPTSASLLFGGWATTGCSRLFNGLRQEGQQWGDEHGIEVDGYGLDRVEVVKGPASLLYGSDAVAGVVNLLPALPTGPDGELHGEALSEYQSVNGLVGNSGAFNYQKNGFQTSLRGSHRWARDYQQCRWMAACINTGFRELNLTGMVGVQKSVGRRAPVADSLQRPPGNPRRQPRLAEPGLHPKQVFDGEPGRLSTTARW